MEDFRDVTAQPIPQEQKRDGLDCRKARAAEIKFRVSFSTEGGAERKEIILEPHHLAYCKHQTRTSSRSLKIQAVYQPC